MDASERSNSEHNSFLILTAAAGSIAATFVNGWMEARLGRARTLTISVLGMILFVAAPGLTTNVWLIAAAMFIGGAFIMIWNIITVSYRQAVTPDHLLGRLNSVSRLIAWGTMPIGAATAAVVAETLGLRAV